MIEDKAVQQVYQGIHDEGGLWQTFPEKTPIPASAALRAVVDITQRMHGWRGLSQNERRAVRRMNEHWQKALADEIEAED